MWRANNARASARQVRGSRPAWSRPATGTAHVWRASAAITYGVLLLARHACRHSPGSGVGPPSVAARGTDCAGVLPPARLAFRHSPGRGGRPANSVQARLVRPASLPPSLTGPPSVSRHVCRYHGSGTIRLSPCLLVSG